MKRKMLMGSIGAVIILVLAPFTSVIGFQESTPSDNTIVETSPLFHTRTLRSTNSKAMEIQTQYLGKGTRLNLFFSDNSPTQEMITNAITMLYSNPALLNELLKRIEKNPYLIGLFNKNGVNQQDVKNYITIIKNNPSLVMEELSNIEIGASLDDTPQPLGLSTSSALGCFIVALIVVPIITAVLTLFLLLFTLRILTCLDVNGCGTAIAEQIWNSIIQGLTQE